MVETLVLKVRGMTCALCSLKIESNLENKKGIRRISVNYASEKANLEYDPSILKIEDIKKIIRDLGFIAEEIEDVSGEGLDSDLKETRRIRNHFIFSLILSAPLTLAMILGAAGFCHETFAPVSNHPFWLFVENIRSKTVFLHNWKLQLALATPVQFIAGFKFYRNAFYAVKSKSASMDVLVALGTTATYFYSLYICLFRRPLFIYGMLNIYFEASTTIITLVLLGKYLERRAKDRTSGAIQELLKLKPKRARVVRDAREIEIPVEDVAVGDILIVKAGEKVPVDGIVVEGYSTIDESMITGESVPVEKKENDPVFGSTINNYGTFKFKATKIGRDTLLSKIIQLVEEAQASRAPIQKIADKVCGYFVPVVLLISIITFITWFFLIYRGQWIVFSLAILNAVAVLVVSCPCALGLATPTALMVGMGVGAKKGVLIKRGEFLETACKIDTVVFDKTGTLTCGRPQVTDVIPLNTERSGLEKKDLVRLAAIAEKGSEHPLGKAIYEKLKENSMEEIEDAESFEALPGFGVKARIHGRNILIGTRELLTRNNVNVDAGLESAALLRSEGKSVVHMAVDGSLEAVIALEDSIREESRETVKALRNLGIKVVMLTGDNKVTADALARKAGIEEVIAEVLPDRKAEVINRLKASGRKVAMVGDGINDAPALAAADVGFTVGTGTDVAIETSDIVLLSNDLLTLPLSVKLSKQTMRKIKQNLFWAFIYNLVGIPIAASGRLNPVIASAAMALSSVSVLLNSLSLKRSFSK